MQHLMTTDELAARLGVAPITPRKWRIEGKGPPFIRLGRSIRYSHGDVEAWIARQTVSSTSESRPD